MLLLSEVPSAVASRVVYLLFVTVTIKVRVKFVDVLTAPLTPSVAFIVKVNVPASDTVVLGVIVNTLSVFETVAIEPKPDVEELHVRGNPSGSVDTAVIVVAVPSIESSYVPLTPVIALGASFWTVAIKYQPEPL
jgi:hypothetical protein